MACGSLQASRAITQGGWGGWGAARLESRWSDRSVCRSLPMASAGMKLHGAQHATATQPLRQGPAANPDRPFSLVH